MRKLAQFALRGYKRWISPMLPVSCRYVPTCSEYAEEAIERFGIVRGGLMAAWRLLRCNPFGGSGYDPVEPCHSHCGDAHEVSAPLSPDTKALIRN